MITGPIEYLQQDESTPEHVKAQLRSISNNTNRMLRLINQVLDFRKMNHYKLRVEETEIFPFVKEISKGFEDIALARNIRFTVENSAGREKIWIDKDAVEKIVFNLLSNAFKYTPEGKYIRLSAGKNTNGRIYIEVKDEGCGIPLEKQKKLFTRFESFNEDKSKPSTGIGLALTKGLADKHHASIQVKSEPGKGSCFTIIFLPGSDHFGEEVEMITYTIQQEYVDTSMEETELVPEKEVPDINKPCILVVEDDEELRKFMRTVLIPDYYIFESRNGIEGLKIARERMPDFIVSDIMMPEMDGIQFLEHLKADITTSHIPVVLLTAKSLMEDKLKGLNYGADDYITKPFSITYFKARIENLLKQRKHLQEWYRTRFMDSAPDSGEKEMKLLSKDEVFIRNVVQFVENNLDNPEFNVDQLVSLVGMSRTAFFKKIKSLTGLAPAEFIRDIRFKRAAVFLQTGQFTVKEVSYMIGMTDTKHFSKSFKAKYGFNPSEYKGNEMQK